MARRELNKRSFILHHEILGWLVLKAPRQALLVSSFTPIKRNELAAILMFWVSNILSPNHCDKSGAGFQFLDQLIDVHWQFAGHIYFSPTHFCHCFGSRYYEQDDLRKTAFPTLGMNFAHLAPYGCKKWASDWLEMVKNVWYCVSCQPRVLCFENKMEWSITIHKILFQLWPWKQKMLG